MLDQAVARNPDLAAARPARFAHQRVFGSKEEAAADLDAAIKLDGKNPDVILAASRWAQSQGDFEKARALVAEGIERDDADERLLKESAELESALGPARQGSGVGDARGLKNVGKQTRTIELQLFRADLLIDAGKIAEAEDEIRGLRTQTSFSSFTDPRPDFLEARLLVAAKESRQAADLLEKIRPRLEQDSYWNTRVNSLLGLVYAELGDIMCCRIQSLSARPANRPELAAAHRQPGRRRISNRDSRPRRSISSTE